MRSIMSFVFILLLQINCIAQQFQSIEDLLNKAKSDNKNVLLYFSGSDWCAPCIRFKKNYVDQVEFQKFAESNLIIYNADFPRKKVNQLNKEIAVFNEKLADVYNAEGSFPKVILLDHDGKILKAWDSLPKESLPEFINILAQ